jgi:hypothetical protein
MVARQGTLKESAIDKKRRAGLSDGEILEGDVLGCLPGDSDGGNA